MESSSGSHRPPLPKRRKAIVKKRQQHNRFNDYLARNLVRHNNNNHPHIYQDEEIRDEEEDAFYADDENSDVEEAEANDHVSEGDFDFEGYINHQSDDIEDPVLRESFEEENNYREDDGEEEMPTEQELDASLHNDTAESEQESSRSTDEESAGSSYRSPLDTTTDSEAYMDGDEEQLVAQVDALLIEEDEIDGPTELRRFMASFFLSEKAVSRATVNRFLRGLKSLKKQMHHFDHLPLDSRTLFKTPRSVVVEHKAEGTYYHFGLRKGITNRLSTEYLHHYEKIEVRINVDGLPLFKSSRTEFWPILGVLSGQLRPFPIGVWSGIGKPSCPNVFLRDFVNEARQVQEEGVWFNDQQYEVKIIGASCDAPARAFITGTKSHTSRSACPRCKTVGVHYKKPGEKRGRETFPDLHAELRTRRDFIDQQPADYFKIRTILLELDIDLVLDMPFDYMHLVCLGVVKKLLTHWFNRETVQHLITREDVAELSRRLLYLHNMIPCEFARKPRSLDDLARWKATEFRLFLMYTGPIVLKGILPDTLYDHFMVLHCAMKLLSSSETCFRFNTFSKQLIHHFVRETPKLYGPHFITFNIHCLIHLCSDVLRFGPLDLFSCFPFENYLFVLKKWVRHSNYPLAQLVKRLSEEFNCESPLRNIPVTLFHANPLLSRRHFNGPFPDDDFDYSRFRQFKKVLFHFWDLRIRHPNNYVIIDDEFDSVIAIENFLLDENGSVFIVGSFFHNQRALFLEPCDSFDILSIQEVNHRSHALSIVPIQVVKSKAFMMPTFDEEDMFDHELDEPYFAVFPLLMEDKIM